MVIINGLRQMCAWLCQFLYSLIAWLYELFMNLSRVELLTSDDIQPIYQRVTMILAIIMVFYVTFEFVKYVIQPEAMTDKEKGAPKIVTKMVIVVVLIAFVPTIFSTAYRLQNAIIGNQVFSKVILGKQDVNSEAFGRNFSANLFRMFYTVNENIDNLGTCEDIPCEELVSMNINNLATQGEMPHITLGLDETEKVDVEVASGKEKVEEYKIDFNPILAVGVGAFVVYMLVLYCVEVGVRVAQLAYLQIIAPIPIIGYLSPKKDGIFQKWTRQCITTYLDLFIRIAIIYFILLVCEILGNAFSDGTLLENMGEVSSMMKTFIYIALIMGLLIFAKKAPKMLEELFPKMGAASGSFGFHGENAKMVARGAGMALGSSRVIGGAASKALRTHARNVRNGQKPIWTKKGRQQAEQRWNNRMDAFEKRIGLRQAENQHNQNTKKQKEFEDIKKFVYDTAAAKKAAKERLDRAIKTNNTAGIAAAQAEYKAAEIANNQAKSKAKRFLENDQTFQDNKGKIEATKNARKGLKEAEKALAEAKTPEEIAKAQQDLEKARENFKKTNPEVYEKEENLKDAIAKLDEAKTPEEVAKAQEEFKNNVKDIYKTPTYTSYEEQVETKLKEEAEKIDKMRQDVQEREAIIAKEENERHRSVAASAIGGGVMGGLTGAYHGAKATKLSDIPKQVKAGIAADVKRQQAVEKYYDEGGIQGTVGRVVSQTLKEQGFQTPYQTTQYHIQTLDKQIKEAESTIANETSIKSTVDGAEDRLKEKIEESKLKIAPGAEIKTGLKDENGKDILVEYTAGQTVADVYRDYKGRASVAKSEADALAQEKARLERENQTDTDNYREISRKTTEASKKAADLEFAVTQIKKNGARYQFTQIINDPNPEENSQFDQVAVQKIRDAQRAIEVANHDPRAVEDLRRIFSAPGYAHPEDFEAFMTGKFEDFDQFDRVKTAAINASNVHARENMTRKDEKRMAETSFTTMAQKADSDFTGGSGK